jgi:hypothetical protein
VRTAQAVGPRGQVCRFSNSTRGTSSTPASEIRSSSHAARSNEREAVTVELNVEVAAMLREHAAAEDVSEREIVERALRATDLRALVGRIRRRSDLDEDAAMRLVNEELRAVRSARGPRAA